MLQELSNKLALHGGKPTVTIPKPHTIWPPNADPTELEELAKQRNSDIGIKGLTGPIKVFEDRFKEFLEDKAKYSVTFNSGTSALLAAYVGVGIQEGDEVIGPCLTYHAALSPLFILKANPILADVCLDSKCILPEAIEPLITEKTRAITVVHQWGHPCDMDKILKIAHKHNLKVIEDCSHAHGSRYKGKLCGTFGDAAAFSLQTNKTIFAGEGGILVTNNADVYHRATLLGHYRDRSKEEITDPDLQKYWVTGFGLKLRMSPFNAITATHSLKNFPAIKADKHKCLNYFNKRLDEVKLIDSLKIAPDVDLGAWYGFKPLVAEDYFKKHGRDLIVKLLRSEGLKVSPPSGAVLSQTPIYSQDTDPIFPERTTAKVPNSPSTTPNANTIGKRGLSFPTFYNWEEHKVIIDQYIEAIKKVEGHLKA